MKRTVKLLSTIGILVIVLAAVAIPALGCKSKSPTPTTTPETYGFVSKSTPTAQPSVTATPTPTKAPTATAKSTQTSGPTATPTATPKATYTPTPTRTPTPAAKAQTTVSISAPASVKRGSSFIISINITNVSLLALAAFDLHFNNSLISYSSYNATSRIGNGNGSVIANIIQPGLLRVIIDYSDYAVTNSGNGISGPGYLCKLNFTATAQGASPLNFISGQGSPEGEITLIKWTAYTQSILDSVSWINSTITVIP